MSKKNKRRIPDNHFYVPKFVFEHMSLKGDCTFSYVDYRGKRILGIEDIIKANDISNLYIDVYDDPKEREEIGKEFLKFEKEIEEIIYPKYLDGNEIELTLEEHDRILLFMALLSFQLKEVRDRYYDAYLFDCNQQSYVDEKRVLHYKIYEAESFYKLWKDNLKKVVKCRNSYDIYKNNSIDESFKFLFFDNIFGIFTRYLCVINSAEKERFLVGNVYPIITEGSFKVSVIDYEYWYDLFTICPISPTRAIVVTNPEVNTLPREELDLRPMIFKPPVPIDHKTHTIGIRVKKVFDEEMRQFNEETDAWCEEWTIVP